MSEHTQGEWSVDLMEGYEEGADLYVLDSDGFPIATIEASPILHNWHERYPDMPHWADGADDGRTQKFRSDDEVAANAHLLRTAPELLDALIHIEEYWNRDQNDTAMADALWHIIGVAQEAIAKARGEV